ncbi:hypothetical protein FB451DRAFT_1167939 [Mycena latifolia]|nr:hypothetical protein FB451DRAFT_1167939 [Mycena latifolia]
MSAIPAGTPRPTSAGIGKWISRGQCTGRHTHLPIGIRQTCAYGGWSERTDSVRIIILVFFCVCLSDMGTAIEASLLEELKESDPFSESKGPALSSMVEFDQTKIMLAG